MLTLCSLLNFCWTSVSLSFFFSFLLSKSSKPTEYSCICHAFKAMIYIYQVNQVSQQNIHVLVMHSRPWSNAKMHLSNSFLVNLYSIKSASTTDFLKTHIRDFLFWVCGTETNSSSPTPSLISLCYIAVCRLSGSHRQVHNLKIWTGLASDLPCDAKPCSLARWTRSIRIQQDSAWKGIGETSLKC